MGSQIHKRCDGAAVTSSCTVQIPQGFPLAGQINQANYAQFAAVLAQQAARQRQAQELAAQQRAQQVGAARCRALQHDPACVCWLLYLVAAFSSPPPPGRQCALSRDLLVYSGQDILHYCGHTGSCPEM